MGNIFFTSDTHFGHKNVIRYCNRPFESVEVMDESIIQNWNSIIRSGDDVYHLGDFKLTSTHISEYVSRLNGRIHLIKGNHDSKLSLDQFGYFHSVCDIKVLKYNKRKIIMCHYSMRVWPESHYGSIMLYGHSHGTLPGIGRSMDVGVDVNNFTPISIEEIVKKFSGSPIHPHLNSPKGECNNEQRRNQICCK